MLRWICDLKPDGSAGTVYLQGSHVLENPEKILEFQKSKFFHSWTPVVFALY